MVLGMVIGFVRLTGLPMHSELPLLYSIPYPVEWHVHGLGTFCLDGIVGYSFRRGIICLDRGGAQLWVAHFL